MPSANPAVSHVPQQLERRNASDVFFDRHGDGAEPFAGVGAGPPAPIGGGGGGGGSGAWRGSAVSRLAFEGAVMAQLLLRPSPELRDLVEAFERSLL